MTTFGAGRPALSVHKLPPCVVLEAPAASRLLASRTSRVVSIIATFDAGKTSLIAALYDAFQRAPVGGARFAGSSTLHSFEIACHDSRSASRRDEATMFRTPVGEARFYHLDLSSEADEGILTLLIADRAGEEYLRVSEEITHAEPLFEVRRADTITLLVDGERLVDSIERHNVRMEVESIVQGLADAAGFNADQRLAIALTKGDAVQHSKSKGAAEQAFSQLNQNIRRRFCNHFADIETFVTAASPKHAGAQRGTGIPELLSYWLRPVIVQPVPAIFPTGERDFDHLRELSS